MKKEEKIFLFLLILIFIGGTFLRFYRLEEFAIFLADQGRDAIIIKRILTLEHLPAIGPPSSVGQVYLGPFYYYFIAPWLWFFKFNPVGLAFGVAFFSSCYILINYFIIKNIFNPQTALISSFLIAFSSVIIEYSRFSWNPNLLPLFTLLTLYTFIQALKKQKIFYFFLFGSFLSFCLQLHYLSFFLFPPLILLFFKEIYTRKDKKNLILNFFFALSTFLFFSSPLVIFDFRHQFLNMKNFFNIFKNKQALGGFSPAQIIESFNLLNRYIFNTNFNLVILFIILISIFLIFLFNFSKRNNFQYFLFVFLFLLLGISLYKGEKHPHYFQNIYPVYIVIIAKILSDFPFYKNIKLFIISIFLAGFIFLNSKNYFFLKNQGNHQIQHAKKVAEFLNKVIKTKRFNFAVQPDGWQEDAYLYFLELKGKRPVDRQKAEIGEEMFVICGKKCDLYATNSWNIKMFGPFKIVNHWEIEKVNIYRLVHQ